MAEKYEITKMLTLSTAHITPKTAQLLEFECDFILLAEEKLNNLIIYPKEKYGYFIIMSEELEEEDLNTFPSDLANCVRLARSLDCTWLCLDCDGPIIEELEAFDW